MASYAALAAMLLALTCAPLAAAEPPRYSGDLRVSYFAVETEARDGSERSSNVYRSRLRGAIDIALNEEWRFRGRLAGRYSTDQDSAHFWLKAWSPTRTGLRDGDTTLDEFYLDYAPANAGWSLRAGRFQSKFELPGVAAKSLDRNDSPNVDVTWTDGLHWRYHMTPEWQSHLVLQRNVSSGTGTTARAPLSFSENRSRVTVFGGLQSAVPWGPVKLRMIGLTWMPESLATEGLGSPVREDYLALTARASAEWPLSEAGRRLRLGGELGWAPNTPDKLAMNTGTSGNTDGRAAQFYLDLVDFLPRHSIGFVYGRAGGGWLVSPDFRSNNWLMEVRYQWRFSERWSMEARVRRRKEIEVPADASGHRTDDDIYIRISGRVSGRVRP